MTQDYRFIVREANHCITEMHHKLRCTKNKIVFVKALSLDWPTMAC